MRVPKSLNRAKMILLAFMLATTMIFAYAASPARVGATSYGIDISGCSWAGGNCIVHFGNDTPGTICITWYTNISGYNATSSGCYTISGISGGSPYQVSKFIATNQRADMVVFDCPGWCGNFWYEVQW